MSEMKAIAAQLENVIDGLIEVRESLDDLGRDDLEERADALISEMRELASSMESEASSEDDDGPGPPPDEGIIFG